MIPLPPGADALERLLEAIPRVLQAVSFQSSLTQALELLREGAGAEASVVFVADGDAPLSEHWAPDDLAVRSTYRPRLKVEALAAIRRGGGNLEVTDGEARDGFTTRTLLLASESGPLGAVVLAWSSHRPDPHQRNAWIEATVQLLATVLIHHSELSKLRNQAERDRRWFKTLDDHLRVLDRERQKFAAVVNQTDTFVFVADQDRVIRWNNRAMAVLLPFDEKTPSWTGKPCDELCQRVGQGGLQCCDCPIWRALTENEVTHAEWRPEIAGAPGVLYLTALPIKGLDGKPHEAMVQIQDLTALEALRQGALGETEARVKGAEAALRDAEARLNTVISASPLVVFALDRNGIYTVSAGRGLTALGRKAGEVVGRSVYEMYGDYPEVLANVDRCLAGEEFSATVEIGRVSFEAHYTPVRNKEGEVTGIFGVATDITDRRELETQLRHAQKMEAVGRLAGGVAHDFNNLLTVIQGQSEVLLAKLPPDSRLRAGLEEVQKASQRGALLTRQLLAFSRRDHATPRILDLGQVVRDMEGMLQRLIGEDVHLVTRLGQWPLHVRADQGQLEQVLANLAVNARDAMPYGGALVVEVSALDLPYAGLHPAPDLPDGPYVALTVSDEGCGITPEIQSHLFEPFFTTKEQGKGTGLGLSVVYGIVRGAGGDIRVESVPGQGANFRIFLPRVDEGVEPDPTDVLARSVLPETLGRGTILLVEDEDAVRALARDFLRVFGFDTVEASSGEEAIEVFETARGRIQGVISDIVMPGMSGVELARHLTALEPGLKVLLVSGYARDSFDSEDLSQDGFLFLQKPYTMEDFGRKLQELTSGATVGDRPPPD